ncbi:putative ATP-dependent hsl protease ATP-binding subunit hslU, partial [Toxoplasma gondii TgCatPRC2]
SGSRPRTRSVERQLAPHQDGLHAFRAV